MQALDPAKLAKLHASLGPAAGVDPGALVGAATEALRARSYEQCEKLLEAALLVDPELAPAWRLHAQLAIARNERDVARSSYERAMTLDDRDPLAAVTLAELYAEKAASDPRAKDRALALANWILLEGEGLSAEITERATTLKRTLRAGARS